jgi:hypothetical protein
VAVAPSAICNGGSCPLAKPHHTAVSKDDSCCNRLLRQDGAVLSNGGDGIYLTKKIVSIYFSKIEKIE